jgi:aminodeoxyfutalosine deaminase
VRPTTFPKIELHVHLEGTLPELVAAGVSCSISTDDPAMFDTDLASDYAAAGQLGVDPKACYVAGLRGALCDEPTRELLRQVGDEFDWSDVAGGEAW